MQGSGRTHPPCERLTNKSDLAFICFDVVEFYPSISEDLLNRALDFASEHLNISASERQTIINSKHSLLFSEGQPWEKRTSASNVDVTMGTGGLLPPVATKTTSWH